MEIFSDIWGFWSGILVFNFFRNLFEEWNQKWRYEYLPYGGLVQSWIKPKLFGYLLTNKAVTKSIFAVTSFMRKAMGHYALNVFIAADCPHSFMLLQALRFLIQLQIIDHVDLHGGNSSSNSNSNSDDKCSVRDRSPLPPVRIHILPPKSVSSSTSAARHLRWFIFDATAFAAVYTDYRRADIGPSAGDAAQGKGKEGEAEIGYVGIEPPSNQEVLTYVTRIHEGNLAGSGGVESESSAGAGAGSMEEQDWFRCMQAMTDRLLLIQQQNQGETGKGAACSPKDSVALLSKYVEALNAVWVDEEYKAQKSSLLREFHERNNVSTQNDALLKANTKLLHRLGYYGSGLVEFCGEWYSHNRLHHLERNVLIPTYFPQGTEVLFHREVDEYQKVPRSTRAANFPRVDVVLTRRLSLPYTPFETPASVSALRADGGVIELFYSFRSPYSQLVMDRMLQLCNKFNKRLVVRPVLPMVIRKLSVPPAKVMYLAKDCIREGADFWGFQFGTICDPINPNGFPVYRVITAYTIAARKHLHVAFLKAYSYFTWGCGVDVGTDAGLQLVCSVVPGLHWEEVADALKGDMTAATEADASTGTAEYSGVVNAAIEAEWRHMTSLNMSELRDEELWGVPCVRFTDPGVNVDRKIGKRASSPPPTVITVWGQDKLYQVERYLYYCYDRKKFEGDPLVRAMQSFFGQVAQSKKSKKN